MRNKACFDEWITISIRTTTITTIRTSGNNYHNKNSKGNKNKNNHHTTNRVEARQLEHDRPPNPKPKNEGQPP